MAFKTKTVIEFDYHHIKILQSSLVNANPVQYIIKIQNSSDEEIVQKLSALRQDQRFSFDESRILISLSRQLTLIRYLDLPSQSLKQINSMVGLLSANSTPYSREETLIDYIPLQKTQEGFTKVCVVIAPLETISRISSIFHKVSIKPNQISLTSLGLWYWYKDYKSSDFGVTLVIDRDSYRTEFCIGDSQNMFTSRSVEQLPLSELSNQIRLTMDSYTKENLAGAVKRIVMVAYQDNLADLKLSLEKEFQVEIEWIVQHQDASLDGVSVNSSRGFLKAKEPVLVDLRPPEMKSFQHRDISLKQWRRLAVLAGLALLSVFISLNINLINDHMTLYKLNRMLKESQEQVDVNKMKLHQFEVIESIQAKRIIFADMISEIYRSLPRSVVLKSLTIKDRFLTLTGTVAQSEDLISMQGMFTSNGYFENVELIDQKSMTQDGQGSDFKLTCQVR